MEIIALSKRLSDIFLRACRSINYAVKPSAIKKITYFPVITEEKVLADLLNRANWYFPEKSSSLASIDFPVSEELFKKINGKVSSLETESCQGRFIKENSRIRLTAIKSEREIAVLAKKADAILLWKADFFFKIPRILLSLHKVWIIDKNYFWCIEARSYVWLYNSTIPPEKMKKLEELFMKNYDALAEKSRKFKNAYLFGTGPSVSKATEFDFSDGFRIVANTLINDPKLSAHIKPQVVVFGDFVYHVGPSKYAAKFREQLEKESLAKGYYLVARSDVTPLMADHYPELAGRIISIPIRLFTGPNIITKEKFYVKMSNNSLVGWMIPLASGFADNLFILGCDGRKPGDKMFWSHAKTTHYDDLTQTLVDTHPSAFNKTDYTAFSDQYERDAEELISFGESLGKKYFSLAPSYIPALAKREKKQ